MSVEGARAARYLPSGTFRRSSSKQFCRNTTWCSALDASAPSTGVTTSIAIQLGVARAKHLAHSPFADGGVHS